MDVAVAVWCADTHGSGDGDGRGRSRLVVVRAAEPDSSPSTVAQDDIDAALVLRIQRDDPTALETLLQRHAEGLARYAATIVDSHDTAQDVVQDVFIKIWNVRHTLELHRSIAGLLLRMTRNRALNIVRHERSVARTHDFYFSAPNIQYEVYNAGEARLTAADLTRITREAIDSLPERAREVFLMRRQGRMSAGVVAEALGISQAAVHVHLSRALRRIAEKIAEHIG